MISCFANQKDAFDSAKLVCKVLKISHKYLLFKESGKHKKEKNKNSKAMQPDTYNPIVFYFLHFNMVVFTKFFQTFYSIATVQFDSSNWKLLSKNKLSLDELINLKTYDM